MTMMADKAPMRGPAERPWLSSYPPGAPAEIDLTGADTLVAIWAESRAKWGRRRALDCFGVPMRYEELGRHADAVAAGRHADARQTIGPLPIADNIVSRRERRAAERKQSGQGENHPFHSFLPMLFEGAAFSAALTPN